MNDVFKPLKLIQVHHSEWKPLAGGHQHQSRLGFHRWAVLTISFMMWQPVAPLVGISLPHHYFLNQSCLCFLKPWPLQMLQLVSLLWLKCLAERRLRRGRLIDSDEKRETRQLWSTRCNTRWHAQAGKPEKTKLAAFKTDFTSNFPHKYLRRPPLLHFLCSPFCWLCYCPF